MDMVSCMDCSHEFWNDDYQQHIKCISEEEKYSGKDYKPRPGQNKGEIKQDAWIQQIQRAIDSCTPSPKLRNLLERLKDYPNIPRKQAKFQNFVKNSMRVTDPKLVSSVWEIFMSAAETKDKTNGKKENGENNVVEAMKEQSENNGKVEEEEEEEEEEDSKKVKRMSKREKKEERRKEQNKREKKDKKQKQISSEKIDEVDEKQNEENDRPPKKKGKKRKRNDDLIENNVCEEEENEQKKTKKKKSNKGQKPEAIEEEVEGGVEEEEEEEGEKSPPPKKQKPKFNWEQTILILLKNSKENSMCEKKLRKKVLAEYVAQGCHIDSMSILKAKFDRKIKKNQQLVRKKDKVTLVG